MSWIIIFSILMVGVTFSRHNFKPEVFFNLVLQNNLDNLAASAGHGAIHFYNLQDTLSSFAVNAPWALLSGLFRPFVWEARSLLQGVAAVENLIILILTFTALKHVRYSITRENWLLIYTVLLASFLLCIFLALSTPNFGTLSRYRTGFLPFFVFLLMCQNKPVELIMNLLKSKLETLFGR